MRAPPKVYVAMSYIQRCDAIEGGWERQRPLEPKEELVKKNALDYLNLYFLGEIMDQPNSKKKRKKNRGNDESAVNVE